MLFQCLSPTPITTQPVPFMLKLTLTRSLVPSLHVPFLGSLPEIHTRSGLPGMQVPYTSLPSPQFHCNYITIVGLIPPGREDPWGKTMNVLLITFFPATTSARNIVNAQICWTMNESMKDSKKKKQWNTMNVKIVYLPLQSLEHKATLKTCSWENRMQCKGNLECTKLQNICWNVTHI